MPWHDEARMAGLAAWAAGSRYRGKRVGEMSRRELLAVIADQAQRIERRDWVIGRLNERIDQMEAADVVWITRDA